MIRTGKVILKTKVSRTSFYLFCAILEPTAQPGSRSQPRAALRDRLRAPPFLSQISQIPTLAARLVHGVCFSRGANSLIAQIPGPDLN